MRGTKVGAECATYCNSVGYEDTAASGGRNIEVENALIYAICSNYEADCNPFCEFKNRVIVSLCTPAASAAFLGDPCFRTSKL